MLCDIISTRDMPSRRGDVASSARRGRGVPGKPGPSDRRGDEDGCPPIQEREGGGARRSRPRNAEVWRPRHHHRANLFDERLLGQIDTARRLETRRRRPDTEGRRSVDMRQLARNYPALSPGKILLHCASSQTATSCRRPITRTSSRVPMWLNMQRANLRPTVDY